MQRKLSKLFGQPKKTLSSIERKVIRLRYILLHGNSIAAFLSYFYNGYQEKLFVEHILNSRHSSRCGDNDGSLGKQNYTYFNIVLAIKGSIVLKIK